VSDPTPPELTLQEVSEEETPIISGQPPIDLAPLSPSRLAVQTKNEEALRENCRRQYAFHYWSQI